jgi:hypothetical protein
MKIAKKDLEINEKAMAANGTWFCKNADMIIQGLVAAGEIVKNFWAKLFINIALQIVRGLKEKYCPVK